MSASTSDGQRDVCSEVGEAANRTLSLRRQEMCRIRDAPISTSSQLGAELGFEQSCDREPLLLVVRNGKRVT